MVYVVMHTPGGMEFTIAARISPIPYSSGGGGLGKWPDCHVLDALSVPGLAKGCTVGRPSPTCGPPTASSGGGG